MGLSSVYATVIQKILDGTSRAQSHEAVLQLKRLLASKVALWQDPLSTTNYEQEIQERTAFLQQLDEDLGDAIFDPTDRQELSDTIQQAGGIFFKADKNYPYTNRSQKELMDAILQSDIAGVKAFYGETPIDASIFELAHAIGNAEIIQLLNTLHSDSETKALEIINSSTPDHSDNVSQILKMHRTITLPSNQSILKDIAIENIESNADPFIMIKLLEAGLIVTPEILSAAQETIALYKSPKLIGLKTAVEKLNELLLSRYAFQALQNAFPLEGKQKEALLQAIEEKDEGRVQTLLKSTIPDLDCLDRAFMQTNQTIHALISESIKQNHLQLVVQNDDPKALAHLVQRGIKVEMDFFLRYMNSQNKNLTDALFEELKQTSSTTLFDTLFQREPDIVQKLCNKSFNVNSNAGSSLVHYLIKKHDIKNLDLLKAHHYSFANIRISAMYFFTYMHESQQSPNLSNLMPMLKNLVTMGYKPDASELSRIYDQINKLESETAHQTRREFEQFAMQQDDVKVLEHMIQKGLKIDVDIFLQDINSDNKNLTEMLFAKLNQDIGAAACFDALFQHDPNFVEKLCKNKFNLNSKFGEELVRYLIRKNDIKNLNLLKSHQYSLANIKISPFSFLTYLHEPPQSPNFNDLVPMLKSLLDLGYAPSYIEQTIIFNQISARNTDTAQKAKQAYLQLGYIEKYTELATRTGHTLGLSDSDITISFNGAKKTEFIKFEGSFSEISQTYLIEHLQNYLETENPEDKQHFQTIYETFSFVHDQYKNRQTAGKNLFDRYRKGEMTFLASGWSGHSVGITLYKGYLIYTNRGSGGDQLQGTKIFKLRSPDQIDENIIAKIFNQQQSGDKQDLLDLLTQIVDLNAPLISFPSKGQKRGTCSYANHISSIEAMLALLAANEINPHFTDKQLTSIAESKIQKRETGSYKQFTRFARNQEIDRLIERAKSLTEYPDPMEFYYTLFKIIITQHHGQSHSALKDQEEIKQARKMLAILSDDFKARMQEELPYILPKINPETDRRVTLRLSQSTESASSKDTGEKLNQDDVPSPVERPKA